MVSVHVAKYEGGLWKVEGEEVEVGGVPLGAGGGGWYIKVSNMEIRFLGVILDRYGKFFKVRVGTYDGWLNNFFKRDGVVNNKHQSPSLVFTSVSSDVGIVGDKGKF